MGYIGTGLALCIASQCTNHTGLALCIDTSFGKMRACGRAGCGRAGVTTGKMRAKVRAQQCGVWVICWPKNAGLPILKHYEIHLRNAQDSYAYAGLKCYSEENLKRHKGVDSGAF